VAPPDLLDRVAAVAGPDATVDGRDGLPAVLGRLLDADSDLDGVVLHDADRPGAPPALAAAVADELARGAPAGIPLRPVTETLKEIDPDGYVVRTVPREGLSHPQTPAGLDRAALTALLATAPPDADVADLVRLALGAEPGAVVLPGDPRAGRTRTGQLAVAE